MSSGHRPEMAPPRNNSTPLFRSFTVGSSGALEERRASRTRLADEVYDRGGLPRTVHILQPSVEAASNSITTSKYTPLNFVPFVLYELLHPFKRFANFYFLCVGAMQMVPAISLTEGVPSTWSVLILLIIVDAAFMLREDLARHRADKVQNSAQVEVLPAGGSAFERKAWADVREGDVVKVYSREIFPADLLLLRASEPTPGQCWVNTKPLDGESDTKLRLAPKQLPRLLANVVNDGVVDVPALQRVIAGEVWVENPNDKVNDFTGQLRLDGQEPVLLNQNMMLLRGCQLRTTDWVLCLVISCGFETKINYGGLKQDAPKVGMVAKRVNKDIIGVVVWLVLVCVVGGTLFVLWIDPGDWYLSGAGGAGPENSFAGWLKMTLRFFLLEYQFVPVSLYVSMNIIYVCSRAFLLQDLELYDEAQDEPCQVRQMSLLDELGQVTHIFSDKTGTLTSNRMEFRRVWVDGVVYGTGETAISRCLNHTSDTAPSAEVNEEVAAAVARPAIPSFVGCKASTSTYVNFEEAAGSPSLFQALCGPSADAARRREMMVNMAVNHSVLLEMINGREELSASSPDEQAFVAAAEYFGFELLHRDSQSGTLTIRDKIEARDHIIEVLAAFPYESSRKRMSVVVRLPPALVEVCDGDCPVRLYSKGADSVMFELLAKGSRGSDEQSLRKFESLLNVWADIALRTLVFAKREIEDFESWNVRWTAANESAEEVRKLKLGEPNLISELTLELERELVLQGATAIEDKLQDGVPEVLADLRRAGIKIWMLTGDKVGTAKNIATACNIIPPNADVLEITVETFPVLAEVKTASLVDAQHALQPYEAELEAISRSRWQRNKKHASAMLTYNDVVHAQAKLLDAKHSELTHVRAALEVQFRKIQRAQKLAEAQSFCLVIDEKAIEYCGTICRLLLAEVGDGSHAVVACRARKDQKAQMLNLIKGHVKKSCCLAIGDGANDVAMIKAGQIGVGIIGKEGMQAVNNSDFAIGQFRFLRSLLLVHGRYAYKRMALFCYYMFYKNVANVLVMYFYTMLAKASGERIFLAIYIELYNMVYTAMPIIFFGVFDQDTSKRKSAKAPELYAPGIRNLLYTHKGFIRWMSEAVLLAALTTYLPIATIRSTQHISVDELSLTSMFLVVLCANLRLVLEVHSWGFIQHLGLWGTLIIFECSILYFSYYFYSDAWPRAYDWNGFYGLVPNVYGEPSWWLSVILVVHLVLLPRLFGKSLDTYSLSKIHSWLFVYAARRFQVYTGDEGSKRESNAMPKASDTAPHLTELGEFGPESNISEAAGKLEPAARDRC